MHDCILAHIAAHGNTRRSCTCHAMASLCKGLSGTPSLPALRKHLSPQQVKLSMLTIIPKQGAASPSSMLRCFSAGPRRLQPIHRSKQGPAHLGVQGRPARASCPWGGQPTPTAQPSAAAAPRRSLHGSIPQKASELILHSSPSADSLNLTAERKAIQLQPGVREACRRLAIGRSASPPLSMQLSPLLDFS